MKLRLPNAGAVMITVLVFIFLFAVAWCCAPTNASIMKTEYRGGAFDGDTDLPLMVLGKEEAKMMKQHLIDTGEYIRVKGFNYFIRTYDAGRTQPPGMDEYYHLTVHMLYVPVIATGFNIGLEYSLREGSTDEWGCSEKRTVIQYRLDDGDEDLNPNSMLKVDMETNFCIPTKYEIKPVDVYMEWRYWVYFWYSTFLKEGMK